jgi:uncharacterized membrane protein
MAEPDASTRRETTRMEAFSDAVFAIAITLPIVEIQVPEVNEEGASLAAQLMTLWPSYLGYLLSFLVIGLYWAHHHFSGKIYSKVDHVFLLITLLFLMSVGFVAFPTRVFSEFVADAENRGAAATFYATALFLVSLTWLLKWLYGTWAHLVDERLDPAYIHRLTVKYVVTTAIYAIAAALTLLHWGLGITVATLITLFYLRPPERPVYLRQAHGRDR